LIKDIVLTGKNGIQQGVLCCCQDIEYSNIDRPSSSVCPMVISWVSSSRLKHF